MANREIRSTTAVAQLREYATLSADAKTAYVDRQGWDAVLFMVDNGALTVPTTGTNTLDITIIHADDTPDTAGSYAAAAATDVTNTLPLLGDTNATAQLRTIGYVGNKRYVALDLNETGDVSADLGVWVILQKFGQEPSNAATVTTDAIS
jgi:hypothetical protein